MEKRRKYEFKKDKRWKKVRILSVILLSLAIVLIVGGGVLMNFSSKKPIESQTMNAQISKEYGTIKGECTLYSAYQKDKEALVVVPSGKTIEILSDETFKDEDGNIYYHVFYIEEEDEEYVGYILASDITLDDEEDTEVADENVDDADTSEEADEESALEEAAEEPQIQESTEVDEEETTSSNQENASSNSNINPSSTTLKLKYSTISTFDGGNVIIEFDFLPSGYSLNDISVYKANGTSKMETSIFDLDCLKFKIPKSQKDVETSKFIVRTSDKKYQANLTVVSYSYQKLRVTDGNPISLALNKTYKIPIKKIPLKIDHINYKSEDSKTSVSNDGVITAKKHGQGTVKIEYKVCATRNYCEYLSEYYKVNVINLSLYSSSSKKPIYMDLKGSLNGLPNVSGLKKVTTSNSKVINTSLVPKGVGAATIGIYTTDGSFKKIYAHVFKTIDIGYKTIVKKDIIKVGNKQELKMQDYVQSYNVKSSNPNVATVSKKGVLKAKASGKTKLTITMNFKKDYRTPEWKTSYTTKEEVYVSDTGKCKVKASSKSRKLYYSVSCSGSSKIRGITISFAKDSSRKYTNTKVSKFNGSQKAEGSKTFSSDGSVDVYVDYGTYYHNRSTLTHGSADDGVDITGACPKGYERTMGRKKECAKTVYASKRGSCSKGIYNPDTKKCRLYSCPNVAGIKKGTKPARYFGFRGKNIGYCVAKDGSLAKTWKAKLKNGEYVFEPYYKEVATDKVAYYCPADYTQVGTISCEKYADVI